MWLPETAVDPESLELIAEQGLRFMILAPHQASHVRAIGGGGVGRARVTSIRHGPYRCAAVGRSIAVFFYDGPVSRAVAFDRC